LPLKSFRLTLADFRLQFAIYHVLAMKPPWEFSRLSLARQIDPFHLEYSKFEREVHILILGTLDAANTRLEAEFEDDKAKITAGLDESTIRSSERLTDDLAELQWFLHDQQRFLLNMAVVGLASRLTHSLRQMARFAESFSARKKKYGGGDKSEFERLWSEFKERFDLEMDRKLIAFIEPLREVRNQIVHDGGVANPYKFKQDIQQDHCDEEREGTPFDTNKMLDHKFSSAFPDFVDGEGADAEVAVNREQLQFMVKNSLELVKWCAVRIRERGLAVAKADDDANPGRRVF
jgi:hypothetical protein